MHSQWQLAIEYLGETKSPLLIIDNFAAAPEQLISEACDLPGFSAQASDFYPGLRKPVNAGYAQQSLEAVEAQVKKYFAVDESLHAQLSLCAFSLTTTPAEQLRPIQAVPHIDTPDPLQFAMVHYLCSEHFGGTSFYKHRRSGYETITQTQMVDYFKSVKQELMTQNRNEFDYINGDTELFQRIGQVPVKFNRCIIYRSNLLHSGDINPQLGLSANPHEGRLTLNSFFRFC
jgi:hypothetical protein